MMHIYLIQAEINQKKRMENRKIVGAVDQEHEKEIFKNQTKNFKSKVSRGEDACYKLNTKPVSLNEGNYRVKFEPVDPKVQTPALQEFESHNPTKRFYNVSPCVLNAHECNLQTRKAAKEKMGQSFNSSMQMEENFFENRGLDNRLQ